ncbi:hypothetical protein GLR48_05915 [Loktanella sp. M215]|nr:hypothetical protein [Loktanella sp. M215]
MQTAIVMPSLPRPDHPPTVEPIVRPGPAQLPHESFETALANLQKKGGAAPRLPALAETETAEIDSDAPEAGDADEAVDPPEAEVTDTLVDPVMDVAFVVVVPARPAAAVAAPVDVSRAVTPGPAPLIANARDAVTSPVRDGGIVAHAHLEAPPSAIAPPVAPQMPASGVETAPVVPAAAMGIPAVARPPITVPEDRTPAAATDPAPTSSVDAGSVSRVAINVARGAVIDRSAATSHAAKADDGPRSDRSRGSSIGRAAPVVANGPAPIVPPTPPSLPISSRPTISAVDPAEPIATPGGLATIAGPEAAVLSVASAGSPLVTARSDMGSARPQTPLLAQHVAQQLSVALHRQAGGATDIALDPVELGRVRMTVTAHDQTITMVVVADRPETADLMRRHVDVLQQEFRGLGYTSVNLTFERGQDRPATPSQDGPKAGGAYADTAPDDAPSTTAATAGVARRAADGSLDLRL